MEILVKAGQLLLSLSILVIFHEFGHFAFARLFKTRVEKFYLFFNPWFSLFKTKWGETEYTPDEAKAQYSKLVKMGFFTNGGYYER